MEELFLVLMLIIILIIVYIFLKFYQRKEEETEKIREQQEYEKLHTLNGRINFHRNQELSAYKLDEYKIGDWEKIVRKNMHSIVKINNQYKINKEINVLIGDYDKMSVSNSVCIFSE